MVAQIQGRSVLDITAAVEEHSPILPDGVGKGAAVKVRTHGQLSLNLLGNTDGPSFSEVVDQATHFALACYCQHKCRTMTEVRQQIWVSKVSRSKAAAP